MVSVERNYHIEVESMDTWKMRRYLMVFIVVSLANCLLAAASPVAALPLVWKKLAPFEDPRTGSGVEGAAASLIGDRIYVSHGNRRGDRNQQYLSIYDIPTDTWTHPSIVVEDPSKPARAELAGGTASVLGQQRHYAIGGRDGVLVTNAVEEFNPSTNTWTTKAPMPTSRAGVAAASWDNKIYALGGRTLGSFRPPGPGTILDVNEVYDPLTDTWTPLAPMPLAVSDHYATIAVDGKIYVFGGLTVAGVVTNVVQIYDIANNTWDDKKTVMPTPRADAIAGVVGGQIAVMGGFDPVLGVNLDVTELYDPLTNSWSSGPSVGFPMPEPVSEMAQGVTYDSRGIFLIGSGPDGTSGSAVFMLQVIPEPATVRLLMVGAAAMLLLCLRYSALSRGKKISL
jgi:hypothetical protein